MQPPSTQQFSGIFVSYRRDDSSGHAGRLSDRLVEHFGRDRIFVDIDTIEPGEDFVTVIENAVGSCEILIAVIGRNWLSASGSGRLDNRNDFVRLEIATALRRDIRVIPVLVQRASVPKPEDLPEDLVKLTRRNAIELSDLRWQSDVDQLISVMEKVLARRAEAKEAKLADQHRNVEAEQEARDLRADVEGKVRAEQQPGRIEEVDRRKRKAPEITQRSEEDETPQERHVGEARVRESYVAAREKGQDAPANKLRLFMFIAGASVLMLLAATILIWRSQRDQNSPSNISQAAPQPSVVAQPTAKPTETLELTPSPRPDPFREATLWKRADAKTMVRIVRSGNTLRAIMVSPSDSAADAGRRKGDLAFEGSYEGHTIKGKAYILFLKEDVNRCPSFRGNQTVDLTLTLSADGNTLRGSREDPVLSDDCTIINSPRKRLTYIKVSP